MSKAAETLRELEAELKAFQKIEQDMNEIQKKKKTRNTQKNENEMVQEELKFLGDDAVLYKLVGPALIKQSKADVEATVTERIKFVTEELSRCDSEYKALVKKREEQREKVIKLQQLVQQTSAKK